MRPRALVLSCFLYLCLWLTGCQDARPTPPAATVLTPSPPHSPTPSPPTPTRIPSPTPIPPTPTPAEPLAALVNDQPIFLSRYEKELARYEQAQQELGRTAGADGVNYHAQVLDALIEQTLIAQAAAAAGIQVSPEMVEAKLAELRAANQANFAAWLQANQWTEEEFREALAAEMLTELVVSQVTADVPYAVEQVHARYLQVDDAALAQSLLDQIRGGADFAALAGQYSLDQVTGQNGGDLGYFARGSLLVPEVEAAAFALAPGEVSEVMAVAGTTSGQTTYYLVQVIERDPERPLTADSRYELLRAAFEAWLADLWAQAKVQRFINPGQDT